MSDDLVKQLRNSKGWPTLGNIAADRIEELEAKLAKAVEALRDIAGMDLIGASATAYNALRSIKGETK